MDTMRSQQQAHDAALQNIYTQHQMSMYTVVPQFAAQPPTLYSNGPSVMTPTGSPRPLAAQKPSILLDTDFDNSYYPSTPPLSSSGSTVGSPKNYDALQTPMNPMFSGNEGDVIAKETVEIIEPTIMEWPNHCASPPLTPMYFQSAQFIKSAPFSLTAASTTSDPFSACPSLSPSPAPYARSVAASEQDVDFCDPRNLTVAVGSANVTLASEASVNIDTSCIEVKPVVAVSQPTFEFNPDLPDGLPSFEELSDLQSEEDFVNSIVNLSNSSDFDSGRPRACTGSSVVSLGHGSFIGEEDTVFGGFDGLDGFEEFTSLPSPPSTVGSFSEDLHRDKRSKKTHKKEVRVITPAINMAATDAETGNGSQCDSAEHSHDHDASESPRSTSSDGEGSAPAPTSRRGRKQSLTEDPSKTFVCELCNRRFRRQEHLKRHYRSLHTQEKPFECNECGKTFSRSDNLAQHARTHGSGAIVMGILEEGEVPSFDPNVAGRQAGGEDYSAYSKVLFQIASEVPGSSSEMSSDDDGKKKRKRSD